jgi:hypothetical protein
LLARDGHSLPHQGGGGAGVGCCSSSLLIFDRRRSMYERACRRQLEEGREGNGSKAVAASRISAATRDKVTTSLFVTCLLNIFLTIECIWGWVEKSGRRRAQREYF